MERISQILKKRLTSHDFSLKYIFKESILVYFFSIPWKIYFCGSSIDFNLGFFVSFHYLNVSL